MDVEGREEGEGIEGREKEGRGKRGGDKGEGIKWDGPKERKRVPVYKGETGDRRRRKTERNGT